MQDKITTVWAETECFVVCQVLHIVNIQQIHTKNKLNTDKFLGHWLGTRASSTLCSGSCNWIAERNHEDKIDQYFYLKNEVTREQRS